MVHEWSAPWVEEWDHLIVDIAVRNGLLHLHGFDMHYVPPGEIFVRHGEADECIHDMDYIISRFHEWKNRWDVQAD
jgi:hypothetical protein